MKNIIISAIFRGPVEFKHATIVGRASGGAASFAAGEDRGEECLVCLEHPSSSQDLICGHILCTECYNKLAVGRSLQRATIKCPACRKKQPAFLQGRKFCK